MNPAKSWRHCRMARQRVEPRSLTSRLTGDGVASCRAIASERNMGRAAAADQGRPCLATSSATRDSPTTTRSPAPARWMRTFVDWWRTERLATGAAVGADVADVNKQDDRLLGRPG